MGMAGPRAREYSGYSFGWLAVAYAQACLWNNPLANMPKPLLRYRNGAWQVWI